MKTIFFLSNLIFITLFNQLFSQFSCATAVSVTDGYTSGIFTTPGTNLTNPENWISATSIVGESSAGAFNKPDVYMFQYTTGAVAGESFYFTIECDYAVDGEHSLGVWTGCAGSTLTNCFTSTYEFENVIGVCAQNLLANTTYYIGVGKEWASTALTVAGISSRKLKFKVLDFTVETSTTIPADDCATASVINVADPYEGSTRCNYTVSAGSPSACGMSIDNDSWMKFTAGSTTVVIDYAVSNCTNNYGVQLSVFSGSCGAMSLLAGSCVNYASNNSTGTWTFTGLTIGNTYFIRTDGYAGDLCSYSFSPVSGVIILPIELASFEVETLESGYNKLKWITASERNSDYFEIEKSTNGIDFYSIGKVDAKGNSTEKLSYYEFDKALNSSETYYRLKLLDLNASYTYSNVVSVKNKFSKELTVYPNPSQDGLFNLENFDAFDLVSVYSNEGVLIEERKIDSNLKLDLSQLKNGIYHLKISNKFEVINQKIVLNQ
ncbi:MAG: T9SS type A sorting domain-containing protein [Bacteroidota bacterium]